MSHLDELLRLAAQAEPEPLPPRDVDRVVSQAAATGRSRHEARRADNNLDAMVRLAAEAEPRSLHPVEVDRAVNRAAVAGRARHRSRVLRRVTGVAAVSAALAAAAATVFMLRTPEPTSAPHETVAVAQTTPEPAPAPTPSPTRLELETGDRLLATEQARFTVERATRRERLIELGRGSMMFDVRPIEGGSFTVVTSDARVTVLGTVFTVQATERGTTVRVYEGRVRLEHDGQARIVSSGGTARVGDGDTTDPLAEPAREAAARRTAHVAQNDPSVELAQAPPAALDPPSPSRARRPRPEPTEPRAAPPSGDPTASEVRAMIAAGRPAEALQVAHDRTSAGELEPWLMLEADALRALHRVDEAAGVYARAAEVLGAPRRQQAGYLAARLLATAEPLAALGQLDSAGVTEPGSPLRERGLALRVDLLGRLGRSAARSQAAATYLSLYPDGSRAARMQELAASSGVVTDP